MIDKKWIILSLFYYSSYKNMAWCHKKWFTNSSWTFIAV